MLSAVGIRAHVGAPLMQVVKFSAVRNPGGHQASEGGQPLEIEPAALPLWTLPSPWRRQRGPRDGHNPARTAGHLYADSVGAITLEYRD